MKKIILLNYLFLFQISCTAQTNPIIGTWSRGFQPRIETLIKIHDSLISKPYRSSVESITFNTNYTFIHDRHPPCGNDNGFNKKGTYSISNNELVLKYNGGEEHHDFFNNNKKYFTKKETVTYLFNYVDANTITVEDKYFDEKAIAKEEERKKGLRAKGLKAAEKNGFIKGSIGDDFIWFPSYEITNAWLAQMQDLVKNQPNSKSNVVTIINDTEYLSHYIFNRRQNIKRTTKISDSK